MVASDKSNWARFKGRFSVPAGATQAAVAVVFNKTHGDFWITDLGLQFVGEAVPKEGGDHKTAFSTNRDGFLFYPGDYVTLGMNLDTPAQLAGDRLDFAWELTDFWGEPQAERQKGRLMPAGKAENGWDRYHSVLDLSKLPLQTGLYYEVRTSVDLGAATPARDTASFAVLPDPATRQYDASEIPFGAHTWTTTIYELYSLSARLGLRHTLAFWTWPNTPPYMPAYDSCSNYDSRLGWAKKFGMTPWGGLYPTENVEHHTGAFFSDEALREGVRQSIEKYSAKDGLWAFQIGSEPPSLDAVAYYHLVNELLGKKFVKEIDYPNGVDGFLFRDKDGNDLIAFWGTKDDGDYSSPLPGVQEVDVTHYDGRSAKLDARGRGINLRVTEDPELLTFHDADTVLPATLEDSLLRVAKIPDEFVQGATATITLEMAEGKAGPFLLSTRRHDATTGDMTYEVAIPWKRIAPFRPRSGADLGLGMIINEHDGIGRRSSIDWFEAVHLKETDCIGDVILGN